MSTKYIETITSEVVSDDIVPLARKCIEKIEAYRAREDAKFIRAWRLDFNSKWYNKLFKKFLKDDAEAKLDIEAALRCTMRIWYPYPNCQGWEDEGNAIKIIKYYSNRLMKNEKYIIPIEIYNDIASWAKKDIK